LAGEACGWSGEEGGENRSQHEGRREGGLGPIGYEAEQNCMTGHVKRVEKAAELLLMGQKDTQGMHLYICTDIQDMELCLCCMVRTGTHRNAAIQGTDCTQLSGRISRSDIKGTAKWILGGVGAQLREMRKNKGNELTKEEVPHYRKNLFLEIQPARWQGLLFLNSGVQGEVRKKGRDRAEALFVRTKNHYFLFSHLNVPPLLPKEKGAGACSTPHFAHF
jgi:hypothetical protein